MHFVHIIIIKQFTLPPMGAKQLIFHQGMVLLAHLIDSSKGKKVEEQPKRTVFHVGTPLPVPREVSDPHGPNDSAYGTPRMTKKW